MDGRQNHLRANAFQFIALLINKSQAGVLRNSTDRRIETQGAAEEKRRLGPIISTGPQSGRRASHDLERS